MCKLAYNLLMHVYILHVENLHPCVAEAGMNPILRHWLVKCNLGPLKCIEMCIEFVSEGEIHAANFPFASWLGITSIKQMLLCFC